MDSKARDQEHFNQQKPFIVLSGRITIYYQGKDIYFDNLSALVSCSVADIPQVIEALKIIYEEAQK